jgi:hypothetical protein
MSAKQKRGKGKYAYQAKVGKREERPAADSEVITPIADEDKKTAGDVDLKAVEAPVINESPAKAPVSIGKISLLREMKRIVIFAVAMFLLLVVLSFVLK